jgi:uncharacterized protein
MIHKTLTIRLTPKASRNKVGEERKLANGEVVLAVYVTAVPEHGKANEAMLGLLAEYFGLPPSKFSLVRGHTSRIKTVLIAE